MSTFAVGMKNKFCKYKPYVGISMLYLGVLLMLVGYLFGWTDSNSFTLTALLLIIGGVAVHVAFIKRKSQY